MNAFPFSAQITKLLEKAGYVFESRRSWARMFPVLRYQKKFLTFSSFYKLAPYVVRGWQDKTLWQKLSFLRRKVRLLRLYRLPDAQVWDVLFVRDKTGHKITLLDRVGGWKSVYWSSAVDMEEDCTAQKHFESLGIAVPQTHLDKEKLITRQKIIGAPFKPCVRWEELLEFLSLRIADQAIPVSLFPRIERARNVAQRLGEDGAFWPEIESRLSADQTIHGGLIPLALVHGDFSPWNVLEEERTLYLIDYERSFQAAPWYDALYVSLLGDSTQAKTAERLVRRMVGEGANTYAFALCVFVMDNLIYLEKSLMRGEEDPHTRHVIRQALAALCSL